jgi:ATP-dependent RNA helicase RhlE
MTTFSKLGLVEPLQRALREVSYTHPTPIQEKAIPHLLEGRDLLGCARTGTGKTAAFALPILQRLSSQAGRAAPRMPRALVLVPTRELAAQVAASFVAYGKRLTLSVAVVYGGVKQGSQVRSLERGADILVATPGRLLDLMNQRHVKLDRIEVVVLDEADHMLDLGFLPDVRRILGATPKKRQTLLFSATMPPPIAALADGILVRPEKISVTPPASTVEEVEQRVHFVSRAGKGAALSGLLADPAVERALVFTRTKRGADKVARQLVKDGIPATAIHGNKSQGQRERTLASFKSGKMRVLVATDIAARGIDVDGITHVVNHDLPEVPETYVHRIGRTARAGARGVAISLCGPEEHGLLGDIEKLIRRKIEAIGRKPEANGRKPAAEGREHEARGRRAEAKSPYSHERASKHAHAKHGSHRKPAPHRPASSSRHGDSRGNTRRFAAPRLVERDTKKHAPSADFAAGVHPLRAAR